MKYTHCGKQKIKSLYKKIVDELTDKNLSVQLNDDIQYHSINDVQLTVIYLSEGNSCK